MQSSSPVGDFEAYLPARKPVETARQKKYRIGVARNGKHVHNCDHSSARKRKNSLEIKELRDEVDLENRSSLYVASVVFQALDIWGRVAKWLCSGLQIRLRRFDSDLGLHYKKPVDQ